MLAKECFVVLSEYVILLLSGVVHEDLRLFLDTHLPRSQKKRKSLLGVGDSKIAAPLADELGISCQHSGVVPEILRGRRMTSTLYVNP